MRTVKYDKVIYYYVFFIKTILLSKWVQLFQSVFMAVCHDSSVKRLQKVHSSMTFTLSKSVTRSLSHACFTMFEAFCSAQFISFEINCLGGR